MILLYLATSFLQQRCFCMRYHHFCKVNDNCYKQQINTSSWEIPGKVPNTLQLYCLQYKLNTSFIDNNSPIQRSIKMKFTPLGSPLNSTQMFSKPLHLVKRQRSYEAVKITHTFIMGKWLDHTYSYFEYT